MRSNGLSWRLLLAAAFSALSLCVIASSYSRAAVDSGDVSVKAPHAIIMDAETGAVLSVSRDRYRPPPALRRLVRWRADRCMAPGCGVPAGRCEIDHTIAWEHGGRTSLSNLAPLCKGHHTIKHHGGWRVEQLRGSGGALEWTSPSARRYRVEPERRVPVFRVTGDTTPAPF